MEKRCIVRHTYGYYSSLIVAATYRFPPEFQLGQLHHVATYTPIFRDCVLQHPFLSAVVKSATTENEMYARVNQVHVVQHFNHLAQNEPPLSQHNSDMSEDSKIADVLAHIHDNKLLRFNTDLDGAPAWRVVAVPLDPHGQHPRALIAFAFAHSHGDGMSGLAFHKSFMHSLNRADSHNHLTDTATLDPPAAELPVLPHMPVSLAYLLGPALGHYLPSFIARVLGLRASVSGVDAATWTGTLMSAQTDPSNESITTAIEILSVTNDTVGTLLKVCRANTAKLTALIDEVFARAMNRHLPSWTTLASSATKLVSSIPINMRKAFGISDDIIGVFGSTGYAEHKLSPVDKPNLSIVGDESFWPRVRATTADLAKASSSGRNHPVGLLSWVSDFSDWTKGQIGQQRDSSWEVSNLGCFDAASAQNGRTTTATTMEKLFFSQPANPVGAPVHLNVVSIAHGDLTICVSWQVGAIGLNKKADQGVRHVEHEFMRCLLQQVESDLQSIAATASRG